MEIDVLSYLARAQRIHDIELEDLRSLLSHSAGLFKNYSIKTVTQNSILIYNKNTRKNIMLKCACNYFNTKSKTCLAIKEELNLYATSNCKNCFLKCLNKHEEGTLDKI
jgi:ABC-type lipoprotein export system ATPase subunit